MHELHNYICWETPVYISTRAVLAVPIGRLPTERVLEEDGWEGVGPGGGVGRGSSGSIGAWGGMSTARDQIIFLPFTLQKRLTHTMWLQF